MDFEKNLIKKITWRIVPFVMVLYTLAYIDRTVVGFAKLGMQADIGLSDTAFGLGAGLFFLGYFLFEVPSNYVLPKFGPHKWFARILFTWGLITALMALTNSAGVFYLLRFLLGMAEAGFYPGILYYLTYWFPQRHRTKATGLFVLASPLAFLIMSPLAGWILGVSWFGLQGWHWLFILAGGAAMIAAFPTWMYLRDTPRDAQWMTSEECDWIEDQLAKDKEELGMVEYHNPLKALGSKYVWGFAWLFFPSTVGIYGLSFWLPTVVKNFGISDQETGWISAIPYIFGIIGIILVSRWASRFRENWIPLAVVYAGAALGVFLSGLLNHPTGQIIAMSVAAFCMYSVAGIFWALPTRYLGAATAAIGIAFVNSFGNIGGFVGPYAVGAVADVTGSPTKGMYFLAAVLLIGSLGTLVGFKVWGGKNPVQDEKNSAEARASLDA